MNLMGDMNTYPITSKTGQIYAFEIENLFVGSRLISKLLHHIPYVSEINNRRLFRRPFDIRAEFLYKGQQFIVCEPYGDSSRYWIGPKTDSSDGNTIDISEIEKTFKEYQPKWMKFITGRLK
jgi:hypothetical protein